MGKAPFYGELILKQLRAGSQRSWEGMVWENHLA